MRPARGRGAAIGRHSPLVAGGAGPLTRFTGRSGSISISSIPSVNLVRSEARVAKSGDSMTPVRRAVLVASALGVLLSVGVFFWTSSFYVRLIASFFLFLSLFHVALSSWLSITKRQARASDYFYFATAILGIVFASVATTRERGDYYAFIATTVGYPDAKRLESEIEVVVLGPCERFVWPINLPGIEWLYGDRLDEDTCSFARRALELLKEQRYQEVPSLLEKEEARHSYWPNPRRLLGDVFYRAVGRQLEAIYYHSGAYPKLQQRTADELLRESAIRYLLSNLWPFVLAFAIALRITRVTADVSDWPL
jgi:hypothetical protein